MIGVIGGMGPYASIDLIKKILDMTKATSDQEHIPLSLISVPHLIEDRTAFLLGKSQTNPGIVLSKIAMQLIEQGATIIGMPCNTAHSPSIIAEIKNRIPDKIIFINMIEKVVHYIINEYPKISKVGVLATSGTLKTRIYNDELENNGLMTIMLSEDDQMKLVEPSIYNKDHGIKSNSDPVSRKATKDLEKAISLLADAGAETIIMGCTEIPLAINKTHYGPIPLIDSTKVLASTLILESKSEKYSLIK